jgi:hypothetical protein
MSTTPRQTNQTKKKIGKEMIAKEILKNLPRLVKKKIFNPHKANQKIKFKKK